MPENITSWDLASHRLDKSAKCLQAAERAVAADDFDEAANRSYYSIFHAMRAVLALDELDFKRHTGVINAFNKDYIKTEIFPVGFSKFIGNAFMVRNDSDYQDFYIVSKNKVTAQIENAREFLETVKKYTMERIQIERNKNGKEE
jgi:uncharacterized protein (UPF0332 family)